MDHTEAAALGRAVSRRRALGVGAAGAAGLTLAGCANSGSFDPQRSTSASLSGTLIPLDQVPVGGVASLIIDRKPAFVARPTSDTVRAFSAICTHQGCTVVAAGDQLICPCHGSHYELLTGTVLRGPAKRPLPPIAVHLANGAVVLG